MVCFVVIISSDLKDSYDILVRDTNTLLTQLKIYSQWS